MRFSLKSLGSFREFGDTGGVRFSRHSIVISMENFCLKIFGVIMTCH